MIDDDSRYSGLPPATYVDRNGRWRTRPPTEHGPAPAAAVTYTPRRQLPRGESLPRLTDAVVGPSERLDQLAHRTLGDPLQFWRICDANDAVDPFDLARPGTVLVVPVPQPQEQTP